MAGYQFIQRCLFFIALWFCLAAAEVNPDKDKLVIANVTPIFHPPYSWTDQCNPEIPKGYVWSVIFSLLAKEKVNYDVKRMDVEAFTRDNLVDTFDVKNFDLSFLLSPELINDYLQAEGQRPLAYVDEPIITFNLAVFVRKRDWKTFTKVEQLGGRKGAIFAHGIHESAIQSDPSRFYPDIDFDLEITKDFDQTSDKLVSGEIDYIITEHFGGNVFLKIRGARDELTYSQIKMEGSKKYLYLAFGQDSQWSQYKDKWRKQLIKMRRSGELNLLQNKSFLDYMRSRDDYCLTSEKP